jgi:hypothetical protein
MPVCARAVQQADGSLLLALDPTRTDLSTCAYVVDDGASNAWRELGNMSIENAIVISTSVGVLWAIAYSFRLIISSVSTFESPEK